ncbi:class I SAM-dependent methyltransferase [Psychrilyobacter atlanticus]|uniref:class I SAM-dependent methyltransferase n=1 Tax=Psychrilyobacter atlanticus TaxID=271091 RepID=UPI00042A6D42|nr:class I SAM-dependent methyltransferase [Psychrilyobacter atlanticus]
MKNEVTEYYDKVAVHELERLNNSYSLVEFESTMFLIKKYFPDRGNILDIGSGPGRYSVELAKLGYDMTLLDLSQAELDIAKEQFEYHGLSSHGFHCSCALDLDQFTDEQFDSILVLGPMYHVHDESDRIKIQNNVHRILKKDGIAIFAYINTWGTLKSSLYELSDSFHDENNFKLMLDGDLKLDSQNAFTTVHFTTPPQAIKEMKKSNFEILSYAGAESFISGMNLEIEKVKEKSNDLYKNYIKAAAEYCEKPQYRDATEHLVIVVKK